MTTRTYAKFGVGRRIFHDVSGDVHRRDAAHVVSLHHTTHVITPPPATVVAGVSVTGPSRLLVGRADVVIATARTSAGVAISGKTFTFTSSNPAAVTVGASDGAVRSIAPGTAVISATVDGVVGTLTITAPTTVAVSSTVTVTWTFDETTMPFSFFPDRAPTGALYFSSSNGLDLSGTPVSAAVTRDGTSGISTFTATFSAPSTAGTIYFQVSADGAVARLLYPIVFRGQTMRTITLQ